MILDDDDSLSSFVDPYNVVDVCSCGLLFVLGSAHPGTVDTNPDLVLDVRTDDTVLYPETVFKDDTIKSVSMIIIIEVDKNRNLCPL